MEKSYLSLNKQELISMVLKLEELKEYQIQKKISSDILINELKEKIEMLEKENEELKKINQKRDRAGRPNIEEDTIKKIEDMINKGDTVRKIAKKLNISIGTVSKYNPNYLKRKY